MSKYYLAYGSNLNTKQMKFRCPTAIAVGTAVLKDYQLLFKGSKTGSYLTIEKAKGCEVPVAVWKVEDSDEQALDRYEGYPTFYYKQEMEIDFISLIKREVRHRKAFVYIMHEDRKIGIPTQYYLGVCLEGYLRFGFDSRILDKALRNSYQEAMKNGKR